MRRWVWLVLAVLAGGRGEVCAQEPTAREPLDGITFIAEPGALYLPAREIAEHLGWNVRWDPEKATAFLQDEPLSDEESRSLTDGTTLVPLRVLEKRGATVGWDAEQNAARVSADERILLVRSGPKRVAINRAEQRLRAWQGERLVLETRVSTGRRGHETPTGSFLAGPYRARRHFSSLYDNAPMPYSIQVTGNVFLHGFTSVPPRAASHGCVRVPLFGRNPARWLYRWLDNGSPIVIADGWPEEPAMPE